jgi:hypothetical protein
VVIWYIFSRFGILYREESGNPAPGRHLAFMSYFVLFDVLGTYVLMYRIFWAEILQIFVACLKLPTFRDITIIPISNLLEEPVQSLPPLLELGKFCKIKIKSAFE